MTYKQLLENLLVLRPEILDQTAIAYIPSEDEYRQLKAIKATETDAVFDEGQMILVVE